MINKNYFLIAAFVFCFAAPVFSMPGEYSVNSGDTLWALAGKYYNDPWKWPAIYEANKQSINDPNRIYPEQKIEIPDTLIAMAEPAQKPAPVKTAGEIAAVSEPKDEAKKTVEIIPPAEPAVQPAAPEAAVSGVVEPEPEAEPEPEIKTAKIDVVKADGNYTGDTFLVEGQFKYDGRVVGTRESKTLIAQGDTVYVDIGTDKGVKKGVRCYIFRKQGRIRTPGTNTSVGTKILRVGVLELTGEVGKKSATAKIYRSFEPIIVGDYIKIIK